MAKRLDIQMLRGLSVIAIVLFHLSDNFLPNGFLGVEAFFVISGYVVTPLIIRSIEESFDLRSFAPIFNFYLRRFLRLAPALLSTLTLFFLPLLFFSKTDDIGTISNQALYTLFGLGNFGAYVNSGNYFSSSMNPLLHTWSLAVEEQIYFFVPIFLASVFCIFRRRLSIHLALILVTTLSFIVSEYTSLFLSFYEALGISFVQDFSFYSPLDRLWQFTLGGVLSLSIFEKSSVFRFLMWPSLIVFLSVLILPTFSARVSSILVSISIGILLQTRFLDKSFGKTGVLTRWIGDRSYSIYLIHMPIIYLTHGFNPTDNYFAKISFQILILLFIFVFGDFQFKFVEQRMRLFSGTANPSSTRNRVYLCLVMSTLVFAANTVGSELASNRMSPLIPSTLTTSKEDTHILRVSECVDVNFNPSKCTWGNLDAKKSVLLVGDSQAYASADGLVRASLGLGMKITVGSVSGCPFLDLQASGRMIVDCEQFKNDVWEFVEASRPDVIVIANRTSGYLRPGSGWRVLLDSKGDQITTTEDAQNAYERSLARMAFNLGSRSNLVIFQNIPEPESIGSPPSVWSYLQNRSAYDGGTNSKVFIDREVRSIEKKLSKQLNFVLFDPVETLCVNECLDGIDVGDTFMDSWHLSTSGSEELFTSLTGMLRNTLSFSQP